MFDKQIIEALTTMPFSAGITGNILAIIKKDLKAIGFRSFPIITFIGEPGAGKTSIARACLSESELEFTFHQHGKISAVQDEIFALNDKLILLDDFAKFSSVYQREKAARYMDLMTRECYRGESGLMLITAENVALKAISPACIDRMFLLPLNKACENAKNKKILNFLQGTEELQEFVAEFANWYQEQEGKKEYIKSLLTQWRAEKIKATARTKDMLFAYFISLNYAGRFLWEIHGLQLANEKIRDNCNYLLERRTTQSESEQYLLQNLFEQIFNKELLTISKPHLYEVCECYCKQNCADAKYACYAQEGKCRRTFGADWSEFYLPQNVLLPDDVMSALIIEKPSKIFQFPRHIPDMPLLVVRDNVLLSLFNSELEIYCKERAIHMQRFSLKKLHKLLFEQNRCLYRCTGKNHICYNFEFLNCSLQPESVVFLRLTEQQYASLVQKCNYTDISSNFYFEYRDVTEIISKWKAIFGNMFALAGTIGEREGEKDHEFSE